MGLDVSGLSHIALRVVDPARAKAFYTGILDCRVVLEAGRRLPISAR